MTDNVITVDAWNTVPILTEPRGGVSVEDCFNGVCEEVAGLKSFTAMGFREDGTLYLASTEQHTADLLMLIERVKQRLMLDFIGDELA